MPVYEYNCEEHGRFDAYAPLKRWNRKGVCPTCGSRSVKLISVPSVYGTVKFHEKAFADASEAANRPITSTKDIDAAEKAGEFYAITNPSRHRKLK